MSQVVRRSYMRCSDQSDRFDLYLDIWNQIARLHSKGHSLNEIPMILVGDRDTIDLCFSEYTRISRTCKSRPRRKTESRLSTIPCILNTEFPNYKKLETNKRMNYNRKMERIRVMHSKQYRILKNRLDKYEIQLASIQKIEEERFRLIELDPNFDLDYEEEFDTVRQKFFIERDSLIQKINNLSGEIKKLEPKIKKIEELHPVKKSDVKSLKIHRKNGHYFYQILKSSNIEDHIVNGVVDIGIATDKRSLSLNLLDLNTGEEKVITLKANQVRRNNYKYLDSLFKEIGKSCRFVFLNKHEKDIKDNLRDIDLIIKRLGRARQAEGAIVFKIIQDSGILSRRRRKNQPKSQVLASACMEQGYAEMEAPKVPPLSSCWFH